MPPKKQQIRVHLYSPNELEEFLAKDGLKVVDAYTEWCGPCRSVEDTLKSVKLELADDKLHYCTACTDKIPQLKGFHGTSEPAFLFYGGTTLVNVIRGLDAPKIAEYIKDELAKEHEALEGKRERVEFEGIGESPASRVTSARKSRRSTILPAPVKEPVKEEKQIPKEYTFALIKPTAMANGNADAIFAKLAEGGFKVAVQDERTLSREFVEEFYGEHKGKPFFEKLTEFMSSGPVKPMVLTAASAVTKWRELIGPTNSETAREEAPDSIRALYGTDQTANAVHGSDGKESAEREIEFFFPEWAQENLTPEQEVLVVTPECATTETVEAISAALTEKGFEVRDTRSELELTEYQVHHLFGEESPPEFVAHLSGEGQKCAAIVVRRIRGSRLLMDFVGPADVASAKESAPERLRAKYGEDNVKCGIVVPNSAEHAVNAFFGDNQDLVAEYKDAHEDYKSTAAPAEVDGPAGEEEGAAEEEGEAKPAEQDGNNGEEGAEGGADDGVAAPSAAAEDGEEGAETKPEGTVAAESEVAAEAAAEAADKGHEAEAAAATDGEAAAAATAEPAAETAAEEPAAEEPATEEPAAEEPAAEEPAAAKEEKKPEVDGDAPEAAGDAPSEEAGAEEATA